MKIKATAFNVFTATELQQFREQSARICQQDEINAYIGYIRTKAGTEAVEAFLNGLIANVPVPPVPVEKP